MNYTLIYLVVSWHCLLATALAIYALRARSTMLRMAALVALGPLVIGVLAWLAALRAQPGYLDVAIAIALLGIAETLTILRTVERRRRTGG